MKGDRPFQPNKNSIYRDSTTDRAPTARGALAQTFHQLGALPSGRGSRAAAGDLSWVQGKPQVNSVIGAMGQPAEKNPEESGERMTEDILPTELPTELSLAAEGDGTTASGPSVTPGVVEAAPESDLDEPKRIPLSRPNLDRQLIRIQRDVLKMGALVENSCLLARQALCDRDLEAAKRIPIQDKQIDSLYRQIEVDCTNLIGLQSLVSHDLRLMSAFMQMVRDLERIGDYTKSISSAAIKLFPHPVHECMDDVGTMLDRCRSMVALCLRSLSELDPEAGYIIKRKDDVVDDDYERLYSQLVSVPCEPSTSIEPIVLLVLVIRSLERIADHATNVGKRVTYVVTGERF